MISFGKGLHLRWRWWGSAAAADSRNNREQPSQVNCEQKEKSGTGEQEENFPGKKDDSENVHSHYDYDGGNEESATAD